MTEINEADIEEAFYLPVNFLMGGGVFNLNINIPFKADALQIFNIGVVDPVRATQNHISIRSTNLPLLDSTAFIITVSCGAGISFFESIKNFEPSNQLFLLDNTQFIDGTYNFRAYNINDQLLSGNFRMSFIMKFMKFKQQ